MPSRWWVGFGVALCGCSGILGLDDFQDVAGSGAAPGNGGTGDVGSGGEGVGAGGQAGGGAGAAGGGPPTCGDDNRDPGEECDDGNTEDADGCEGDCTLPACGNGIGDPGELCLDEGANIPTQGATIRLATGDWNDDGDRDLFASISSPQVVSIFYGKSDGTFVNGPTYGLAQSSQGLAVADFNQDGRDDFAVSVMGNVDVYNGNGAGGVASSTSYPAGTSPRGLEAGDVNNDAVPDLVVANIANGNKSLIVFTGTAGAGLTNAGTIPMFMQTISQGIDPAIGDFNGDGTVDLAAAHNLSVQFFPGPSFAYADSLPNQTFALIAVAAADLNGDDRSDVAFAEPSFGAAHVALATGSGFGPEETFSTSGYAWDVGFGDLGGDDAPDLVVNSLEAGALPVRSVCIYVGNGDGTFGDKNEKPFATDPHASALADLNADGKDDLVVSQTDHLAVFLADP